MMSGLTFPTPSLHTYACHCVKQDELPREHGGMKSRCKETIYSMYLIRYFPATYMDLTAEGENSQVLFI